jgi:hypothetical protein
MTVRIYNMFLYLDALMSLSHPPDCQLTVLNLRYDPEEFLPLKT